MRYLALSLLILFGGCATKRNLAKKYSIDGDANLAVSFIKQAAYQCGPASLAMVLNFRDQATTADEISSKVFTPGKKGSYQSDMVAAVRRYGLLAVEVSNLKDLLTEIHSGNPVLILQNLGLSWFPKWHYAVVKGYDLKNDEIILHSGPMADMKMSLFSFENTWEKAKRWGLVIVKPGQIPVTVSESDMLRAVVQLEQMQFSGDAVVSYRAILKKWPGSFGAQMGLGNVYYNQQDYKSSALILGEVTKNFPESALAWHNYAWALKASNNLRDARLAAQKALNMPEQLLPSHLEKLSLFIDE